MSNFYNMPKLPTENSPKVEIFVDDKAVMVPGDTNLLEALKAVGIETPHVCYHPYLPVSGNCRQCLVEQEGPRGRMLVIACYTPVAPGMKIYTPASSARVKNARKATQEFMLVNHPLDCPICDKAGECTLQENFMEAGQNESRMRPEYGKNYHGNPAHQFIDAKGQLRGGKHVDLGPRVLLDEERCVQCDRCVRFMRTIAGSEQLQLAGRADHTYITTFPGEKLDHEYDLCVTDVCPVGAMTAKYFRFQKRVWLLSHTPTVSMDDSLGANIWLDHADGHIYRVMPRCNPEVNRSWLSNTSRLAFQNFDKNRLPAMGFHVIQEALAEAKRAVKSKSPSREFHKLGVNIDEGLILGIKSMMDRVGYSGRDLGKTAISATEKSIKAMSFALDSIDTAPTIRPVVDLSGIQSGVDAANSIFAGQSALQAQMAVAPSRFYDPNGTAAQATSKQVNNTISITLDYKAGADATQITQDIAAGLMNLSFMEA